MMPKSVRQCIDSGLDYVFFGHIFPTTSHPNELPRTNDEIEEVLNLPIPIYAIGGISQHTIAQVSQRFAGICAISFFMNASLEDIKRIKKEVVETCMMYLLLVQVSSACR